jgi:hypothetical protein
MAEETTEPSESAGQGEIPLPKGSDASLNNNEAQTPRPFHSVDYYASMGGILEPPGLHTPHKRRRMVLIVGLVVAAMDLCCLPITYFYALNFGTNLNRQDSRISPGKSGAYTN